MTVVVDHHPYEVTTLRHDVETDGRRAKVKFTDDWEADAMRRDFTMNALYCDAQGKIHDFTNGYRDILRRKSDLRRRSRSSGSRRTISASCASSVSMRATARVRRTRRALPPACASRPGLDGLSAERIRQEMFKLMAAPRCRSDAEADGGAGHPCASSSVYGGLARAGAPAARPAAAACRAGARSARHEGALAAFQPRGQAARRDLLADAAVAGLARHGAEDHPLPDRARGLARPGADRLGALGCADGRCGVAKPAANCRTAGQIPVLPVSGGDLLAAGMNPGPEIGVTLSRLEDWWVASGFTPGKQDLLKRLT